MTEEFFDAISRTKKGTEIGQTFLRTYVRRTSRFLSFFFFLSFFSFFFNFHTRTGQRQNFIGQKFVATRIYIRTTRIIVKQFYLGDSFPKLVSASRTVFGKYLCTGLPERIRTREEGERFPLIEDDVSGRRNTMSRRERKGRVSVTYSNAYAARFVCRGLDFKVPSRSILNTPTNLSLKYYSLKRQWRGI